MTASWITLVAGVGIGSIVASLVAAWTNKTVAIAGHRQDWINALRDHLSEYFYLVDKLQAARGRHDTAGPSVAKEARDAAKKEYRQILMRLNAGETQHQVLAQLLVGLLDQGSEERLDTAVGSARAVLKREWEVTKGYTIKRIWRGLRHHAS